MDYLRKIQPELGITILVNLHQVAAPKKYSERTLGSNPGHPALDDPPSGLDKDTIHTIYGTEAGELIID
jgi:phosphonate transport system ATP-binding protein